MNNLHKIKNHKNIILTDRQQTVVKFAQYKDTVNFTIRYNLKSKQIEKLTNNKWAKYTDSYFIWSRSHLDATINLDLLEVVYE